MLRKARGNSQLAQYFQHPQVEMFTICNTYLAADSGGNISHFDPTELSDMQTLPTEQMDLNFHPWGEKIEISGEHRC